MWPKHSCPQLILKYEAVFRHFWHSSAISHCDHWEADDVLYSELQYIESCNIGGAQQCPKRWRTAFVYMYEVFMISKLWYKYPGYIKESHFHHGYGNCRFHNLAVPCNWHKPRFGVLSGHSWLILPNHHFQICWKPVSRQVSRTARRWDWSCRSWRKSLESSAGLQTRLRPMPRSTTSSFPDHRTRSSCWSPTSSPPSPKRMRNPSSNKKSTESDLDC